MDVVGGALLVRSLPGCLFVCLFVVFGFGGESGWGCGRDWGLGIGDCNWW